MFLQVHGVYSTLEQKGKAPEQVFVRSLPRPTLGCTSSRASHEARLCSKTTDDAPGEDDATRPHAPRRRRARRQPARRPPRPR